MRFVLAGLLFVSGPALAQTASPPMSRPPAVAPAAPAPPPAPAPGEAPAAPAPPEAPPGPPPPPTDPVAIAVLATLDNVCVPLVDGGDIGKLGKANGFRKSGDVWVMKQKGYQITIQPQGSNPDQCHVDLVHPVDPESPAKAIIVALHNWAAVSRGWSLYRNDKNVASGQEFTTRSWETDQAGKHQALVLTTIRKPNGSPMKGASDTSQMIYSSAKAAG